MNTTKIQITSIDEYIQGFPEQIQAMLSELRSTIRLAAPHATEKISYQMPCFHFNGTQRSRRCMMQHDEIFRTPGRFGWDGGLGTSAYTDPAEGMIGILFTPRMMDSPEPPKVFTDFWTLAYGAMK